MNSHPNQSLFLSEEFSDVTFIVDNKSIPAHKIMLAANCPYFKTMLFGATNESEMSTIKLINVSYKKLVEVLRCVYLRQVHISEWTPEEVKKLILIADEYQFHEMGRIIGEAVNIDYQITIGIIEDVFNAAKRLECHQLMHKCAALVQMKSGAILTDEEAFNELPMDLVVYLIDKRIWNPADARLVYSIGNWRKLASIQERKRLLSKIGWKSLPGRYSEPLVRMFLENDVDGLRVKNWTSGLRSSNNLQDQIVAVYLSHTHRLYNECSQISSLLTHEYQEENKVIDNQTERASIVIFFREQVTNGTKIKFTYDGQAYISVRLYGFMGETAISGTTMDGNWEFNVPSNVNFWSV